MVETTWRGFIRSRHSSNWAWDWRTSVTRWPPLVAAMRRLFEQGARPDDLAVRDLAAQWKALFDVTHAGDDGSLKTKLQAAYAQEPELLRGTGLDLPLLSFVGRAMAGL